MATKIVLLPVEQLSFEQMRKIFKKIKQDARATKAASTVEGDKNGSTETN